MIKTYKGKLADDGQDKIRLRTNDGNIGYRIIKFKSISSTPGVGDQEFVTKIYKLFQSSIDAAVNFTDGDLLGVSAVSHSASISEPYSQEVIFDQEIFNQDIYVTGSATAGTVDMNYYLELEQIKLNENQSTMATLQSLRRLVRPRN